MGTRITNSMLFRNALANVTRQQLRLASIQEQATSGLRINKLSDDPVGVRAATLLKAGIASTEQFQRNNTQARSRIVDAESALVETNDILVEARLVALQGGNGILDATSRQNLAAQVEALHDRLVAAGNRTSSDGYIFSGFAADTPAFSRAGPFVDGMPSPAVTFNGDASEIEVEIDEGVRLRTTLNGERVFLGDADGDGSPDAGKVDLFDVLGDLRDALAANDPVATRNTLDRLDEGILQVSLERTDIGSIDSQLVSFEQRLEGREFDLVQRLSDVQDADSIQVFSDLVNEETSLQASLEATSRLLQQNLLDFL